MEIGFSLKAREVFRQHPQILFPDVWGRGCPCAAGWGSCSVRHECLFSTRDMRGAGAAGHKHPCPRQLRHVPFRAWTQSAHSQLPERRGHQEASRPLYWEQAGLGFAQICFIQPLENCSREDWAGGRVEESGGAEVH